MSEPLIIEFLGSAKAYATWSTNRDRKINWQERDEIKRTWFGGAKFAGTQWRARNRFHEFFPFTVVQLEFYSPGASKIDPHNYCGTVLKAAIDGLVSARFWPDDTSKYVGHRESLIRAGTPFLPRFHLYTEDKPWER